MNDKSSVIVFTADASSNCVTAAILDGLVMGLYLTLGTLQMSIIKTGK